MQAEQRVEFSPNEDESSIEEDFQKMQTIFCPDFSQYTVIISGEAQLQRLEDKYQRPDV